MITTDSWSLLGIKTTSRILVIMPHPDDEAIFCGGFLHRLSVNAIATRVVTLSAGEKSTLRYGLKSTDILSDIRRKELKRSLTILGVQNFHIYQYADGNLENLDKKIEATIRHNIRLFHPTHVLTLEPDGIYGHPDHVAVSRFVTHAVTYPVKLLYVTVSPSYTLPSAVWMAKKKDILPLYPDVTVPLRLSEIIAKIKSLRAHRSQFVSPITKLPFQFAFFLKNKLLTHEYFAKGN